MRLIETETGQITAAVSKSVGSAVPASALTEALSSELLNKLLTLYPLRGKIVSTEDLQNVEINIGSQAGVKNGQQFKVLDTDTILEIVSVEPDKSHATVLEGGETLVEGQKIVAFYKKS
jgi:hypothetical protein